MDPEVLRHGLLSRVDNLLSRTWLVGREDRRYLNAFRSYLPNMPVEELKKLGTYMSYGEEQETHMPPVTTLYSYPLDPTPAVHVIVNKLRGVDIPTVEAVHACWHLAGVGLRFIDSHTPEVMSAVPSSDEGKAIVLEQHLLPTGVGTAEIPWRLILDLAYELLRRWLDK